MKITGVTLQKNKRRVNVFIDEEYSFSVHKNVFYDEGFAAGDEINEEQKDKLVFQDEQYESNQKALRLLSRRDYFEEELRKKLKVKFSQKAVDETIKYLKKLDYLNDPGLIEEYFKELVFKNYGVFKIKRKLIQKTGNKEKTEELLAKLDDKKQIDMAKANLRENSGENAKKIRHLVNRGFPYNIAYSAVFDKIP